MNGSVEVFALKAWHDRIELRVTATIAGAPTTVGSLVWTPIPEGSWIPPLATIDIHEAQKLMDSLWDCGLRPSEGSGSAGALKATQLHLDDMRRLLDGALSKCGLVLGQRK